jgi:hypothetical protein
MARKIEWLRPEHEGAELERIEAFAKRRGVTLMVIRGHISRYYDWFPKPVRLDDGRAKSFLPKELDDFLDRILTNDRPRSRAEKAAADVARLTDWVEEKERAAAKRQEELERAERDLKAAQSKLRSAKEQLALHTQ